MLIEILERCFFVGEEPDGVLPDSYYIDEAFECLQASSIISKEQLIRLEFGLFPVFQHGGKHQAKTLYEGVMSEPTLFVELLKIYYKPKFVEENRTPTEIEQSTASTAWQILHECKLLPGTQADGTIKEEELIQFIDVTRQLCRDADLLELCDSTLGQILAHAPKDEDGIWPCKPVREILDRAEFEEMRRGFQIGARNKRGVTTRACDEGGIQERKLADFYRQQAQALNCSHVYLAETLEELAQWYENDGQREDISAKLNQERF